MNKPTKKSLKSSKPGLLRAFLVPVFICECGSYFPETGIKIEAGLARVDTFCGNIDCPDFQRDKTFFLPSVKYQLSDGTEVTSVDEFDLGEQESERKKKARKEFQMEMNRRWETNYTEDVID